MFSDEVSKVLTAFLQAALIVSVFYSIKWGCENVHR